MKRDLSKFSSTQFDLLIIGAGIYGVTAAWDAATRGLSVALIDQGDFGGATSANSLKIVHGGLRYLQQLDFRRMRESIRERRIFMQMAPHLVHPLSCVMPTYGHLMKGPEVMRIGMLMNDIISYDRNKLDDPQKHIPVCKVVSRDKCLRFIPGVQPDRINGGAFWTDAQMYNSDRLILSFLQSAVSAGAHAANYVKAVKYLVAKRRVHGVQVKDLVNGETFSIKSKVVLNMAGGWTDTVLSTLGKPSRRVQLSTAMNIIVNRPMLSECAAGVRGRFKYVRSDNTSYSGYRVLFMTPWREFTIIGTYHRPYNSHPDDLAASEQDIEAFLKEINSAYPGDPVKREDVSLVHRGFLPMDGINPKTGDVKLTKHYKIYNHAREDRLSGMISVVGVKYTTARDVSERAVDLVFAKLRKKLIPNRTRFLRVNGGDIDRFDALLSTAQINPPGHLDSRIMEHLVKNHGSSFRKFIKDSKGGTSDSVLLPGSSEVLKSEISNAVRNEMAVRLTDVVLRRTDLGSAGYPGEKAVETAAAIMASELKWDLKRKKQEVENLRQYYQRMGGAIQE